jgi:hypothetical protein
MPTNEQSTVSARGPFKVETPDMALSPQIEERLKTHELCTLFENHLAKVWPNPGKDDARRHAAIHAFAEAHGWRVTISDPGIRVTFRKR